MKKLREYIFYRVYERTLKNTHNVGEAVSNATYVTDIYDLVFVETLFFILKGIIEFDMTPVTLFYLTYKKSIVIGIIIVCLAWAYLMNRKYKIKVANGWIKELEAKYHKDSYCISTIWIILFPFVMVLGVPIIYGIIKGTLMLTDTHTGEIIWSI